MTGFLAALLVGLVAGIASGLAGVGGGIVLVPAMVYLLDVPQYSAQGTSALAILFTALSGTAVNVRNRHVELRAALVVGLGGVATAFLGARLAVGLDADLLRRLFGALVVVSGARMGVDGWRERSRP